ncbi:MAG: deoxyribodipyrimidine photo-lyase [Armatimonadota bacterium]
MIRDERITNLNEAPVRDGEYVLYWMQASQRTRYNHVLEYAVRTANDIGLPTVVCFGLTDDFPDANLRHYRFMLEGLQEVAGELQERGVSFVIRHQSPPELVSELAADATVVVTDMGYLNIQRRWREEVADNIACRVTQVESDVCVPVELVTDKEEYMARTIRPRIHRHLPDFLKQLHRTTVQHQAKFDIESLDLSDIDAVLDTLDIDRSIGPVPDFRGGEGEAHRLLMSFIDEKLDDYADLSNHPEANCISHMSPYLHFGQISPIDIALKIKNAGGPGEEDYIEQLIIRRELAMNFCHFNHGYDDFESALPDWAKETLHEHADDEREYIYDYDDFAQARTHDPYWNAAQLEMVATGKMHGYMRMYWGKKILEWTETPKQAFQIALRLNNRYELDGRDPNSFTGVAWCFGKHDQGWKERPIFGKTRYMNASGLERKFDMDAYLARVHRQLEG